MITSEIGWREGRYDTPACLLTKLRRRPVTVRLEAAKNWGSHWNFCDYWKTDKEPQLEDDILLLKKPNPLILVSTDVAPDLGAGARLKVRYAAKLFRLLGWAPRRDRNAPRGHRD